MKNKIRSNKTITLLTTTSNLQTHIIHVDNEAGFNVVLEALVKALDEGDKAKKRDKKRVTRKRNHDNPIAPAKWAHEPTDKPLDGVYHLDAADNVLGLDLRIPHKPKDSSSKKRVASIRKEAKVNQIQVRRGGTWVRDQSVIDRIKDLMRSRLGFSEFSGCHQVNMNRLVWILANEGDYSVKGYHAHHIDGNWWNDTPDNLIMLSREHHKRVHDVARSINPELVEFVKYDPLINRLDSIKKVASYKLNG